MNIEDRQQTFFFFWVKIRLRKHKFGHRIVHLDSRDERESLVYPKEATRAKTRLQNPRVEG